MPCRFPLLYSFSISDKALSLYKDFYTKIVCNYATFEKKILSQSIFGVLHKNNCLVLYNFTIKAKHPTTQVMGRFYNLVSLRHIQAAVHVEGNSHRRLHVVGGVVEDGGVGNALFGAVDDEIILLGRRRSCRSRRCGAVCRYARARCAWCPCRRARRLPK